MDVAPLSPSPFIQEETWAVRMESRLQAVLLFSAGFGKRSRGPPEGGTPYGRSTIAVILTVPALKIDEAFRRWTDTTSFGLLPSLGYGFTRRQLKFRLSLNKGSNTQPIASVIATGNSLVLHNYL